MHRFGRLFVAIVASAFVAFAQPASAPARVAGYLSAAQTASVLAILPPPPTSGDPLFQADMVIFHDTRALEGSPRWKLAQSDVNLSIPGLFNAFACSLGFSLTPQNAPQITALLNRADEDAYIAADVVKRHYKHKRPFQVAEGDVCVSPQEKAALERSPDFPSAHATLGWETGLILAQLSPRNAAQILARARAFGQSRVVCGVHNLTAVQGGWMVASAVLAMQMTSPEFRKDLDAARKELETVQASERTKPAGCEAEAQTLAKNPY